MPFHEIPRLAAIFGSVMVVAACATAPGPRAVSGQVQLENGQLYPARLVVQGHPATRSMQPINATLWRAGHRFPHLHCLLTGPDGSLSGVSFLAILQASVEPVGLPAFNGAFTPAEIRRVRDDHDALQLFRRYLQSASGGDPALMMGLLQAAARRDADCLARDNRELQAKLSVLNQTMTLTRDNDGRPVVIQGEVGPSYRVNLARVASGNVQIARMVSQLYEAEFGRVGQLLNPRPESLMASVPPPQQEPPNAVPPIPSPPASPPAAAAAPPPPARPQAAAPAQPAAPGRAPPSRNAAPDSSWREIAALRAVLDRSIEQQRQAAESCLAQTRLALCRSGI